ncbi:MAG TPA: TlpA disulfide reductase family protein [Ramlibacter sp.]|nr:TlpA disulfide reductase family protein [Ramlibacter sp.]
MAGSRRLFMASGLVLALPSRAAQIDPKPAPLKPFEAFDFDGRKVAVPAAGKPSVVNFWASWCEPCRVEMPLLLQLAELYGDKLALQLVNFKEHPTTVQRHVRTSGWNQPVLLDPRGEGAGAWAVKVFPTTVGFDAQGRVRWRVRGEYDWNSTEAGKLVEGLWR